MKYSKTKEWYNWYSQEYRKKNPGYKREWARRWRLKKGMKPRKVSGKCKVCSILLTSCYAGKHNGQTCEMCLR